MRLLHFGISLTLALTLAGAAMAAETVTLKDGRVIAGNYLGGSPTEVKFVVADQVQTLDVEEIVRIDFHTGRESRGAGDSIRLPAGTNLVIRMLDGVDSERNSVGQTFAASLDEPLVTDGGPVIPRG